MLLEEIKNIKSEKKDLRNFGLVMCTALAILGGALWYKGKDTYTIFLSIAAAFGVLGLVLPSLLRPLQKAWMVFAVIMGFIMTRLILSLLFYVVFTAIGGIARLFGKQFLNLKMDRSQTSYWIKRKPQPFDKSHYERQF
jgi:hypothetical protein